MGQEKKFYVLGAANGERPWLLALEPYTLDGAKRAISWQRIGQGQFEPADYWAIGEWDESLPGFTIDGRRVYVGEGPYTEAAWQDFMSSLPGVIIA